MHTSASSQLSANPLPPKAGSCLKCSRLTCDTLVLLHTSASPKTHTFINTSDHQDQVKRLSLKTKPDVCLRAVLTRRYSKVFLMIFYFSTLSQSVHSATEKTVVSNLVLCHAVQEKPLPVFSSASCKVCHHHYTSLFNSPKHTDTHLLLHSF